MKTALRPLLMLSGLLVAQTSLMPTLQATSTQDNGSTTTLAKTSQSNNRQKLNQVRQAYLLKKAADEAKKRSFMRKMIISATTIAALGAAVSFAYQNGYSIEDLQLSERLSALCDQAYTYWQNSPTSEQLYAIITQKWQDVSSTTASVAQESWSDFSSFAQTTGAAALEKTTTAASTLWSNLPTPEEAYTQTVATGESLKNSIIEKTTPLLLAAHKESSHLVKNLETGLSFAQEKSKEFYNQGKELATPYIARYAPIIKDYAKNAYTSIASSLSNRISNLWS